ncbi:MAG: transaldolase [Lachnospiraceae bacterium]|nr:transaldolase [Lachnospiraceae bacterium]
MQIISKIRNLGLTPAAGDEEFVNRVLDLELSAKEFKRLSADAEYIGVTDEFKRVIDTFKTPAGEIPAGFEPVIELYAGKCIKVDLKRNIAFDRNGKKRPTNLLFSADSANPYEVAPVAPFLANLTCNPGIIYDLFINNPKANIDHKFNTRDEVMGEIGRILGPGCDISVELNDPFGKSDTEILEEAEHFKEMLTDYRVVIKVPHTGPVNKDNVKQLLSGDKKLDKRYDDVATLDAFRGHNLALMLHEHGFRVNFTLMFEEPQTQLALQARPYFINSFIRHKFMQTEKIAEKVDRYYETEDSKYLEELRDFMLEKDYFCATDKDIDIMKVLNKAEVLLDQRHFYDEEGSDGLDGVRHNLRVLREANLPDTRLIICSMEGDHNYYDIDRLLASDEFRDMSGRVVLTAEPNYLARFTSANQVVSYQRRFMNAANGQK